jgi:hypothetical protein
LKIFEFYSIDEKNKLKSAALPIKQTTTLPEISCLWIVWITQSTRIIVMSDRETRSTKNNTTGMEATLLRLEASFKQMDKKLDENIRTLQQSIEDSKNELRDDIKNELLSKVLENSSNIEVNAAKIADMEAQISHLQDVVDASGRETDLIVKGVPILGGEKCVTLYHKIAVAIGYSQDSIPLADAFRLGVKKPGAKFDPPILIKFTNKLEKDIFHHKYFNFKNLSLNHIGWNVDQRIMIAENLTKSTQQIFSAAMQLKREKKLYRVSTSHGTVSVKPNDGDRPITIKALSDLDRYKG